MKCPRCQHEKHPYVKFCQECATPLARTCKKLLVEKLELRPVLPPPGPDVNAVTSPL